MCPAVVSSAPDVSQPTDVADTSVTLDWTESTMPNGVVIHYIINITNVDTGVTFTVNVTDTKHEVTGLTPYTNYTFTVAAVNGAGVGNASTTVTVQTAEGGEHLTLLIWMLGVISIHTPLCVVL